MMVREIQADPRSFIFVNRYLHEEATAADKEARSWFQGDDRPCVKSRELFVVRSKINAEQRDTKQN